MKPLMKPIDTPDQVFHDGNPSTGELGTICSAEWLNDTQASIRDIQAECIAILRANGFEPDETKRDQLWQAIQAAIKNHVPAASLVGAGIVQLSSSVTSDSETIAATSKAVKIAMDNGNARMAKDRNGSDIPNKALFRQNLELGNSATLNTGTTAGTVAAGDDARIIATKKAIDDTQTGLSVQGVMWISTADDLSNLPAGARRFATNNTGVTVLPAAGYFFLEVLAKRDTANGTCILATSDARDVWIGTRYTVPDEAGFTWIQLNQNVQNLGLTEAVNKALNAVQKTGDTMSAPLINTHPDAFRLKQPNRSFFWRFDGANLYLLRTAINDPNGTWDAARPLCVNAGSGQVFLGANTKVNGNLYLGDALVHTDGNIYGTLWGGYLNNWLNSQFAARDNNINTRATWDWVNQHFVQDIRLTAPVEYSERGLNERVWGGVMTSWADYGSSNYHIKWRLLQKFVNGQWLTVAYA
ncbi:hypothetical protein HUH01_004020 [Salmonella enterica]|nr:hypothetical protein [Salmonella enterica]